MQHNESEMLGKIGLQLRKQLVSQHYQIRNQINKQTTIHALTFAACYVVDIVIAINDHN
jgi:hypothetical protein